MTTYTARLRQGANIRFVLAVTILILAGIFSFWPSYQQLKTARTDIASLDDQAKTIALDLESQRDQYRLLKNDYALTAIKDESAIATILPTAANETKIVRALEQQARDISGDDNNSLVLVSVNIGSANNQDKTDYLSLPIKISLTGTKEKLMSFLHALEKTGGAVDTSEAATRLIDVRDISLQTKNRGEKIASSGAEVSMEISANAYFMPIAQEQKPAAKKAAATKSAAAK